MRGLRFVFWIAAALVIATAMQHLAFGQYWFQTGADSGYQASYNNGASVYIQTIEPQNLTLGAFGFWVGETIQNTAFLQVGYEIPNSSGYYPQTCDPKGCNGSVYLAAGYPAWFWEYFPAGYSGASFYGGIGNNNSVGTNGTFNRYWFVSDGNMWKFYFNNQTVGSADLGAAGSAQYAPTAYAELAGTHSNSTFMRMVLFKNLSYYKDGVFNLLQEGYAYIGYGTGSKTALKNPYGVNEVPGYADFFSVGSGGPLVQNGTSLWSGVYRLDVQSQFGNVIGSGYHITFSQANFSVQKYVYITPEQREVFGGWVGGGPGSYTGQSNLARADIRGNITETAVWSTQYYVNVSSQFGSAAGSGWYAPNTTASIALSSSTVNISQGTREVFDGWSSGSRNLQIGIVVSSPIKISAAWQEQYLLRLNTSLGAASGSGWYNAGDIAHVSLSSDYFNSTNTTRIAFYSWSGLYSQSTTNITVNSPLALSAIFKRQHLVEFEAKDSAYAPINVSYFIINGKQTGGSIMLFDGMPYNVTGAYYKGVLLPVSLTANVTSGGQIQISLPVYNVQVSARSVFKSPLNASVYLTFKNGTTSHIYLGPSGSVVLQDVPLGYVTGYVEYSIIQEKFGANNGSNVNMLFVTPSVALPIIILVLVMIAYEILHRRISRRKPTEGSNTGQGADDRHI